MKKLLLAATATLALTALGGTTQSQDKQQLAFVVNAASDFWKLAEAGVKKAQAELPNYELQFKYPAQGTAALQNALMDDLVAAGTDAIMISLGRPQDLGRRASTGSPRQVPLFTTDSDAPDSNRIAYLGSSNTDAGVQAGEIDAEGAARRRQVHGLRRLPRRRQRARSASPASSRRSRARRSSWSTCAATTSTSRAPAQCRRRAGRQPGNQLHGRLLLLQPAARSTRRCRRPASSARSRSSRFDEDPITLGGVKEGSFAGTVVQQPFEWGYQGMKLMAA